MRTRLIEINPGIFYWPKYDVKIHFNNISILTDVGYKVELERLLND